MTAGGNDCPAVVGSLKKSQKSWERLTRILGWEEADPRVPGTFFKAVVQEVFLFGPKTWVPTPLMEQALGSFQNRVARRNTGRQLRRRGEGGCKYSPLASAMEEVGFEDIGVYIKRGRTWSRNILQHDQL